MASKPRKRKAEPDKGQEGPAKSVGKKAKASAAEANEKAAGPRKRPQNRGSAGEKRAKKARTDRPAPRQSEEVSRLLRLWNQLRDRQVSSEDRRKLVNEVASLMRGKYAAMSLKHDVSRVVQAVVSFGTAEQVDEVLVEVEPRIFDLCVSPYAHFLVIKLLKSVAQPRRRDSRRRMVKVLSGHMLRLGVHSVGARVVETALEELPKPDARRLNREFYGREHLLATGGDAEGSHRLDGLLKLRPDRRETILTRVWGLLSKMIDKGLCQFVFVQELLCEYLECAGPAQIAKVVPSLAEHAVALLVSRNGSKAAAMLAAYSGARERRKMIKALKGHVKSCIFHRDAYMFLLKLVSVTDDTVSVKKNLLAEIFAKEDEEFTATGEEKAAEHTTEMLMTSQPTTLFFLWLLAPSTNRYFHDDAVKKLMQPSMLPPEGVTVGLGTPLEEVDMSSWVNTSKKTPEQRNREVLAFLRGHLVGLAAEHAQVMLYNAHGGRLLYEIAKRWPSENLHAKILDEMTKMPEQQGAEQERNEDAEGDLPAWEHPKAHLILKWLLLAEAEDASANPAGDEEGEDESHEAPSLAKAFAGQMSDELLEQYLSCNRGAFVIEALSKVASVASQVLDRVASLIETSDVVKGSLAKGNKALAALQKERTPPKAPKQMMKKKKQKKKQ